MKIQYRRITVQVSGDRPKVCPVCNHTHTKKGKPLTIQMHHTRYAYKTSEVRRNPLLALENTVPCCYTCHRILDACRIVNTHLDVAVNWLEVPGLSKGDGLPNYEPPLLTNLMRGRI